MSLQLEPVEGIPEVEPGENLGRLLAGGMEDRGLTPRGDDLLCVAQKIVSKSEDRAIEIDTVTAGSLARSYASRCDKDPRLVQVILDQSRRVVKMVDGVIIAETHHGFVCANAGVDTSNLEKRGEALRLPEDPDGSARRIRGELQQQFGAGPGVLISDTWGRPWRQGQVNFCIGLADVEPIRDYRGQTDAEGRTLTETRIAVADELAAAAELVMGKTRGVPAVLIRGYEGSRGEASGNALIRPPEQDFFR